MDKKQNETIQEAPAEEEKERVVSHTITTEDNFTLAKNMYDFRSFLKSVY